MRIPDYKRTVHHIDGTNNDIINAIESNFNKAVEQISEDGWYQQFEGNSLKETCNNVWRYVKLNVPYQEDGSVEQKIKLPARTIADAKNGIGTDCKSFALLSAAIMSKFAPVAFRYTSYRNDPTPTHVYCVVDGGVKQLFHAFLARCNQGTYTGVCQICHGPLHGVHDFIWHMGGPRGVHKSNARKPRGDGRTHAIYFH